MICHVCGRDFKDEANLRRHTKIHDDNRKTYPCQACEQSFTRSDSLTKHLANVHGARKEATETSNLKCSWCSSTFTEKRNLTKHVKAKHPDIKMEVATAAKPKESKEFKCTHCGCSYGMKKNLSAHIRTKHKDIINDIESDTGKSTKGQMPCTNCDFIALSYKSLTYHLETDHEYFNEVENLSFKSFDEFAVWKESFETSNFCSFVNRRGVRDVIGGKRFYFDCHRSGLYVSRGAGVRVREESKRSVKIGGVCPARMRASVDSKDGSVQVVFNSSHFGHDCSINFLKLTDTERALLASKLKEGVSFDKILDDVRDSVDKAIDFRRFHLLDRRDLWNILRTVEFNKTHCHSNDSLSVDIMVESFKKRGDKNPILFYRRQDQPCTCSYEHCSLETSDFFMVVSTPYQISELSKFLSEKVLIDSTHGTNSYDFQLTTLGSVDESGSGVPIAFCLSNRVSTSSMELFFEIIRDKVPPKVLDEASEVFMSDLANEFYNAWCNIFGECKCQLYCTWHVDKRWRQKVKEKVKGLSKQAEVYRGLISVRNILDKEWFEICLEGMRNMLTEDEDTAPFLDYFIRYASCKEKWAYCYRVGLGLNTNMFIEALFKRLKYCYMKGKNLRRVDDCLHILLRFARDVAYDRMRRVCKGNDSYRQSLIVQSHRRSMEYSDSWLGENIFEKVAGVYGVWEVNSSRPGSSDNKYIVSINEDHSCNGCLLTCVRCSICFHDMNCTCLEFSIKSTMCKHIHAVARKYLICRSRVEEQEIVERVEDGIDAICSQASDNCTDTGRDVTANDVWKPISIHIKSLIDSYGGKDDISENVVQGGLKFLEILRKEIPSPIPPPANVSPPHTPHRNHSAHSPCTPHLSHTPSMLRLTPSSTSATPNSKKISPQRRLLNFHSTKKKPMKKKLSLVKPSFHQEGSFLARFAMNSNLCEIVNIHSRDNDHSYTKMDIDDTA